MKNNITGSEPTVKMLDTLQISASDTAKKAGPIYFTTVYLCFTPLSYANALLEGERSFPADPLGQNVQLLKSYER